MKSVAVVGAGFGGLALAIRLQSAGIAATVIEARDKPGGRAYQWTRDGFTFDAGPTVITDPECLSELWRLSGRDMANDVELLPVSPLYRLMWSDGAVFDYSNDDVMLTRQISDLNPADVAGYHRFLEYAGRVYQEGYVKIGQVAFLDFSSMIKAAPSLIKNQAWRSVYSMVSSFVENEHLREALSFHTLLIGGNPMTTSAIYALIHKLERDGGVWFPRGGTHALIKAMVAHFERLGGTIRLNDPVQAIDTKNRRATGVTCASGWHGDFDAVASNADVMHSYRTLLGHAPRGKRASRALQRKRFSPSLFVVHFGIMGECRDIPHHSILFGPRYKGLLSDIYNRLTAQNPASIANRMMSAVVRRPSVCRTAARCIFTVRSLKPSSKAICLLSFPAARCTTTSHWRGVNDPIRLIASRCRASAEAAASSGISTCEPRKYSSSPEALKMGATRTALRNRTASFL
jgi:phytoene desaturase